MKLLVTGGSGFIGSNFIHYILDTYPDYQIINLDSLAYSGCEMNHDHCRSNPNYKFVYGSITDENLVDQVVKGVDIIVNFAADTHVDNSIGNSKPFVLTNILGTHNLLEAALRNGKKRFHQISTDEVFGHLGPDDKPFDETTAYHPRNPYSASKAAADHIVMSFFHTHELPVTISNCSNNYGPYQFPEKFIPLFITNILQGKKVPLYGDGLNVRDWIHVKDHNRAVDKIIHEGVPGHKYCVGACAEKNNTQTTELILKLLGVGKEFIQPVTDRRGHDRRYAIDNNKICSTFKWKPEISFEDGLKETVEWYKNNKDWWGKILSGEYRQINQEHSQLE